MDVSAEGVFLVSTEHFPCGTEVIFYLPVEIGTKKKNSLCILTGKVVRVDTRYEGNLRGYGIEFLKANSMSALEQIQIFVREAK